MGGRWVRGRKVNRWVGWRELGGLEGAGWVRGGREGGRLG